MSSFSAARPVSAMRESAKAAAGSTDSPFRVIVSTESAMRSMKLSAPGSVQQNRTVVAVANVVGPVVRSRRTS